MESIIHSIQELSSYAVPMIILLGLLIFVHELGHFLVAKYFKVRVEVFSLGFGPKLFKFKRGDTVYAISAIPLGGYVKMFGDDPNAEISDEQRSYSFLHKPVGQRIAVVLAGPIMNLLFAIVLFTAVAFIGEQTLSPQVGDVSQESPAYAVGFRSGDTILAANNVAITSWEEFQKTLEANPDVTLPVDLRRLDGERTTLQITPKLTANKNVLSWTRQIGEVEGLGVSSKASVIGVANPDSLAAQGGLKTGDIIKAVEGIKVEKWRDVTTELAKHLNQDKINLSVVHGMLDSDRSKTLENEQEPEAQTVTLSFSALKSSDLTAATFVQKLGLEFPELFLAALEPNSPAARAGLQKGDRILSINGNEVNSFDEVSKLVRAYGNSANSNDKSSNTDADKKATGENNAPINPLNLLILRGGKQLNIAVSPDLKERMTTQGKEERRFEIGIRPMILEVAPATFIAKAQSPVAAFSRGITLTTKWTSFTVLSFVRMFQAKVSAKNIGGFLSIGQMAKRSWQVGPSQFLLAMSIISINLFILNLLPVPLLDGGHLVFFTIEAVKGAPLSVRKMELAQQVGLVLLLGLMVFSLFNDFSRLFGGHS
jgi:regulator of sigma E protease